MESKPDQKNPPTLEETWELLRKVQEVTASPPEDPDLNVVLQHCIATWGAGGGEESLASMAAKQVEGVELMNYLIDTTLHGRFYWERLPVFREICPDEDD